MMADRHIVFGTAGHVDHGKSSLVLALTGTDPDRWEEEKAREMTIDLGFAFLPLEGVENEAAIVDVPGHEMFVRNMVAGATGIDAAIFIVAADEGVMPQTVEHLDVLRYLDLKKGLIALTKVDRTPDEITDAAISEVKELVQGTFLETAAVIPVSSITGEGLEDIRAEMANIASSLEPRSLSGIFRCPVDRVFVLKGVGTVVTGTVISGSLKKGDSIESLPQKRNVRARTLHVHDTLVERVSAGQRVGINLADTAKHEMHRGDVLASPGTLESSLMVDARLHLSLRANRPMAQRTRVRIHHGTKEVMGRVVLLESDSLKPGSSALVQLRLESPIVPAVDDLFVLRSYSPMRVIGGGRIVNPHPEKHKQGSAHEVAGRESLDTGDIVCAELDKCGTHGLTAEKLLVACGVSESDLERILAGLAMEKQAYPGRGSLWLGSGAVEEMRSRITTAAAELHNRTPLHKYVLLNEITARAAPDREEKECCRITMETMSAGGEILTAGDRACLPAWNPKWSGRNAEVRDSLLELIRVSGLAVPSIRELSDRIGLDENTCANILDAIADSGELILLARGIYVTPAAFDFSRGKVEDYLGAREKMNISDARELLGASRKYLLPFLEELDRRKITVRRGDFRTLYGT